MFSFFFHWYQKSLRVQGGHSCLYLAFKGSLKPGPREGYTHTRLYVHTKTAGCLKLSQNTALISPLFISPMLILFLSVAK